MKKIRFDLLAILTVNFTDSLGFSLVIPILVFLVTRFGGNAFMYGVVGSLYSFCTFLAAPVLGKWSDLYGRKPVILISQIGTLAGWFVLLISLFLPVTPLGKVHLPIIGAFTLTVPLIVLILARAIDGITAGDIAAAQAYIADISDEKYRNRDYGLLSVASNLGFVIGPALAGILASTMFHEKLPIFLAIVISFLAIVFVKFFLSESYMKQKEDEEKKPILAVLNEKITVMLLIYFVLYVGFSIFYTAFPLYAVGPLRWSVGKMGLYFSFLSLLMVIVQGPVLGFLSKKLSDSLLAIVGTIILGVNFLFLTTGNDMFILVAFACFALGNGLMWPSVLSLLSKVAGNSQGTVQGFANSTGSLASIVGLLLGGFLFNYFEGNTFFFSAGVVFAIIILFLRIFSLEKRFTPRVDDVE